MKYTIRETNGEMEIVLQTTIWRESKKYRKGLKKVMKVLDKMN